ncbi:7911_t:CDS:1, partial [Ambispora gerdemannii]
MSKLMILMEKIYLPHVDVISTSSSSSIPPTKQTTAMLVLPILLNSYSEHDIIFFNNSDS